MQKVIISIAAAATALAFAAPASAQFVPAQQVQGYGHNNYGQMRSLQVRVDRIQRDIEQLRARRAITRDEANGLRSEARGIERRLYQAGRFGLQRNEARNIEYRIDRLEQHVRHEIRDGNRGWGDRNGRIGTYNDRDHDGRDDRIEDDHGTHRDH